MKLFETKIFEATDENMEAVNDFIHCMMPADCPVPFLSKLDLAVEEIYINIAHYAYQPESGTVEICCCITSEEDAEVPTVSITFRDKGKPFNPLEKADPDITLSADERNIGGLGIFLTKKFMDEVTYTYENGQNTLRISKKISQ